MFFVKVSKFGFDSVVVEIVISVSLTIHTHGLNVVTHVENKKNGLLLLFVLVFYSFLSLLSSGLSTTKPHEQKVNKLGKGCRAVPLLQFFLSLIKKAVDAPSSAPLPELPGED